MIEYDLIQSKVASYIQNGKVTFAIKWLLSQIGNADKREKNTLYSLCAECYQLIGDIPNALSIINRVDTGLISSNDFYNLNVLMLKICTQTGNFEKANDALSKLNTSFFEIPKSVLWRSSLIKYKLGDTAQADLFHYRHLEQVRSGGFQEANNILFTTCIPNLIKKNMSSTRARALSPIGLTKETYLKSTIDFSGRMGLRIKSLCQSLIVESYIHWEYSDVYDAYKAICIAGLLLSLYGLTPKAEGIGEIIYTLPQEGNPLFEILKLCSDKKIQPDDFFNRTVKYSNSSMIYAAYKEALDFVCNGNIYSNPQIIQPVDVSNYDKKENINSKGETMQNNAVEERRKMLVKHLNEALHVRDGYKADLSKETDPQKKYTYKEYIQEREKYIVGASIDLMGTLTDESQIIYYLDGNLTAIMNICISYIDEPEVDSLIPQINDLVKRCNSQNMIKDNDKEKIAQVDATISARNKLELTIPIIPFLLNYKIETGFDLCLKNFVMSFFKKIKKPLT